MSQNESGSEDEVGTKKEKHLKLKGGNMVVRYVGYKKRGDKEMIIELEFEIDGENNTRIVGRYLTS